MSAGEISFLIGHGDPNSFYRAFHAWTGQTPERVRAAAMKSREALPTSTASLGS